MLKVQGFLQKIPFVNTDAVSGASQSGGDSQEMILNLTYTITVTE